MENSPKTGIRAAMNVRKHWTYVQTWALGARRMGKLLSPGNRPQPRVSEGTTSSLVRGIMVTRPA